MTVTFSELDHRRGVRVLRWSARTIGLMAALLFLMLFIGESMEGSQRETFAEAVQRLWPRGLLGLATFLVYIAAMLIAPHRERLGLWLGSAALGLFFVLMAFGLVSNEAPVGFDPQPLRNPVWLLFLAPLALYALARWAERRRPPPKP